MAAILSQPQCVKWLRFNKTQLYYEQDPKEWKFLNLNLKSLNLKSNNSTYFFSLKIISKFDLFLASMFI